jgi:hypothetical protein
MAHTFRTHPPHYVAYTCRTHSLCYRTARTSRPPPRPPPRNWMCAAPPARTPSVGPNPFQNTLDAIPALAEQKQACRTCPRTSVHACTQSLSHTLSLSLTHHTQSNATGGCNRYPPPHMTRMYPSHRVMQEAKEASCDQGVSRARKKAIANQTKVYFGEKIPSMFSSAVNA